MRRLLCSRRATPLQCGSDEGLEQGPATPVMTGPRHGQSAENRLLGWKIRGNGGHSMESAASRTRFTAACLVRRIGVCSFGDGTEKTPDSMKFGATWSARGRLCLGTLFTTGRRRSGSRRCRVPGAAQRQGRIVHPGQQSAGVRLRSTRPRHGPPHGGVHLPVGKYGPRK